MRKILFVLTIILAAASAQAITLGEFITKCDTICPTPAIKLSGDSVPKMQKEKVDSAIVFYIDKISDDTRNAITITSNLINQNDDMLVVKHNEDDTAVQVFIQPQGEKVELLVTVLSDKEGVVVYLVGDDDILEQENLVNIGGKDLVKEALLKREQQE